MRRPEPRIAAGLGATALAIALLLLAGCGSREPAGEGAAQDEPPSVDVNALVGNDAQPAPPSEERVEKVIGPILLHSGSAHYSNLRNGAGGAICGEVDSKQANGRYGGPRPFVISPEGVGVVSTAARISFDDASDIFPDFYIRYCASPEELQRLGPDLVRAAQDPAADPLPDVPDLTGLDGAAPPPAAASPDQPRSEPAAPPTRSADSFSNAVIRPKTAPGQ